MSEMSKGLRNFAETKTTSFFPDACCRLFLETWQKKSVQSPGKSAQTFALRFTTLLVKSGNFQECRVCAKGFKVV